MTLHKLTAMPGMKDNLLATMCVFALDNVRGCSNISTPDWHTFGLEVGVVHTV